MHNKKNKDLAIQEGIVESALKKLTSNQQADQLDLGLRLANLVSLVAEDCLPEMLATIATTETGEAFISLLVLSQKADHVASVLQAMHKILARKESHTQEVQPFVDTLLKSGISHISASAKQSDNESVAELARCVLIDLAGNSNSNDHSSEPPQHV